MQKLRYQSLTFQVIVNGFVNLLAGKKDIAVTPRPEGAVGISKKMGHKYLRRSDVDTAWFTAALSNQVQLIRWCWCRTAQFLSCVCFLDFFLFVC